MKTKVDASQSRSVEEFLYKEAENLDDRNFEEWLNMLSDDVEYIIPVRVTQEDSTENEFADSSHIHDNKFRLKQRIDRLKTEFAWAEEPPSRTRHHVSNVRISPAESEEEVRVKSNLLLYRNRGDASDFEIMSGEREDRLRNENGEWKLLKRIVYLDQTSLSMNNLSVFF